MGGELGGGDLVVAEGVACLSAAACVVVGADDIGTPHRPYDHLVPFAERSNGRKWIIQPIPDPSRITGGPLAEPSS